MIIIGRITQIALSVQKIEYQTAAFARVVAIERVPADTVTVADAGAIIMARPRTTSPKIKMEKMELSEAGMIDMNFKNILL